MNRMGFLFSGGSSPPSTYNIADYFVPQATTPSTQFYYSGTLSELWYSAPTGPGSELVTYSYWAGNPYGVALPGGNGVLTSVSYYKNTVPANGWLEYQDYVSSPPAWNSGTAYTQWKAVSVYSGPNAGTYYCLVANTGQAPLAGGTSYWAVGDSYDPANFVFLTCVAGHEFNWGKPGGVISPYPGTEYQHSDVQFTDAITGTFDVWLNAHHATYTQTVYPFNTFSDVLEVYHTQTFGSSTTTETWFMAKGKGVIQEVFTTPSPGLTKAGVII